MNTFRIGRRDFRSGPIWVTGSPRSASNLTAPPCTPNSAPRNKARLAELLENEPNSQWKIQCRDSFLDAIQGVWDDLKAKESPSDYLLAHDVDFRARYESGYDFPKVPKFRQDAPAWEAFVQSWCQSVAVEASRRNSQSLLMRTIRAVFEEKDEILASLEADEIGEKLRGVWSKSGAIAGSY